MILLFCETCFCFFVGKVATTFTFSNSIVSELQVQPADVVFPDVSPFAEGLDPTLNKPRQAMMYHDRRHPR